MINRRTLDFNQAAIVAVSAVFFVVCTWTSYARWANFEYRTFDLAYYVQAIWQLIHGRFQVSVEHVPLLGNHVEPIVFLFAPLFAAFRHPMLFVVIQNAALAAMGPIGYNIAKRLGFEQRESCALGALLLITPAAGYIALHEFHPEALTAPMLLLMFEARLLNSVGRHWLWFAAVLFCKENMAPLLGAYCAVQSMAERKRGLPELTKWYLAPLAVAIFWFVFSTKVITPALNPGNIDYLALYDRLGGSATQILWKAITQPQVIAKTLFHSLVSGNLIWALLFPFLLLPLLQPRWSLVAAPVILQHLLSWRSSEWTIYFHYSAPLLPIFWMACLEAISSLKRSHSISVFTQRALPWLLILANIIAQGLLGPAGDIARTAAEWRAGESERARKNAVISRIPSTASIVAPFPYLTHLALRENLYSLHYILKGLKTLSRASYAPPPSSDFVLIDYLDTSTFDAASGYYHPIMKTVDGRVIPSSDQLLHDFLKPSRWGADSRDELTLLNRSDVRAPSEFSGAGIVFEIAPHTRLMSIAKSGSKISDRQPLEIQLHWNFQGERDVFPWMLLGFSRDGKKVAVLTKGLCAPQASDGDCIEIWRVTETDGIPTGDYSVEALFIDNSKRAWFQATGGGEMESILLAPPVSLGSVRVEH
jgi:uncharacterized membrane protein